MGYNQYLAAVASYCVTTMDWYLVKITNSFNYLKIVKFTYSEFIILFGWVF